MLALFAVIVAQMPVSALAMVSGPADCQMPCCEGKQHAKAVQEVTTNAPSQSASKEAECAKRCRAKQSTETTFTEIKDSDCSCELKSGMPTPEPPVFALTTSSGGSPAKFVIDLVLPVTFDLPVQSNISEPGIFGCDSGPPSSRPHCACFGRAPPVLLA